MRKEKEVEFNRTVNNNIKDIMYRKCIIQKQVAYGTGIPAGGFANKINLCHGRFSFYEIIKIAKFLNVNVCDLYKGAVL